MFWVSRNSTWHLFIKEWIESYSAFQTLWWAFGQLICEHFRNIKTRSRLLLSFFSLLFLSIQDSEKSVLRHYRCYALWIVLMTLIAFFITSFHCYSFVLFISFVLFHDHFFMIFLFNFTVMLAYFVISFFGGLDRDCYRMQVNKARTSLLTRSWFRREVSSDLSKTRLLA